MHRSRAPDPSPPGGGLDVEHYDLDLDHDVPSRRLSGVATLRPANPAGLDRVVLQLRGLAVGEVSVAGAPARWAHRDGELTIGPARRERHRVRLHRRPDGAQVLSPPDGAPTWFPVHDVPGDEAAHDVPVRVPEGTTAVANGEPTGQVTGGLPVLDAVDRDLSVEDREEAESALSLQPRALRFPIDRWGPYPFSTVGAVVGDDQRGYALETRTRPLCATTVTDSVPVHELAHRWFDRAAYDREP
ncbi:gluzincin family metallopeptidase [Kineococcus sp. SYSU DK001]|uniref:hypothetical protein n=1 Tax=Kineococcus sp. SYSU DK001 TaxID=3383122 RepID=UPI003D7DBCBF